MNLNKMKNPGTNKRHKRVGRGDSSGMGRTCGRGEKGQKARSGARIRPYFEGGQVPLFRRLPMVRGFKRSYREVIPTVNVAVLDSNFAAGETVDAEALVAKGLLNTASEGLKILGNGEIKKALTVKACCFSESAKAKIEAAGGKCLVPVCE